MGGATDGDLVPRTTLANRILHREHTDRCEEDTTVSNPPLPRTSATGRHHNHRQPRADAPTISTLGLGLAAVALTVGFLLVLSHLMARLG